MYRLDVYRFTDVLLRNTTEVAKAMFRYIGNKDDGEVRSYVTIKECCKYDASLFHQLYPELNPASENREEIPVIDNGVLCELYDTFLELHYNIITRRLPVRVKGTKMHYRDKDVLQVYDVQDSSLNDIIVEAYRYAQTECGRKPLCWKLYAYENGEYADPIAFIIAANHRVAIWAGVDCEVPGMLCFKTLWSRDCEDTSCTQDAVIKIQDRE